MHPGPLLNLLISEKCIQGRILKRAFGKLKLEHVVIGKGQFKQERALDTIKVGAVSLSYYITCYCLLTIALILVRLY